MTLPYTLHLGDSREVLKTLPDNSVDLIVCDPPYGLSKEPDMTEVLRHWLAGDDYTASGGGFMGKTWDSFVPGPADGSRQIMKTPLPAYWCVQEFSGGYSEFELPEITTHKYRLIPLSIKETGTVRALYVHSSVEDWRSALIDGYREERA